MGKPVLKADEPMKDKAIVDSSWLALKAQRKANGLCFTCGEKWTSRNHKCPNQVPLHVIQELLDVFQLSNADELNGDDSEPEYVEEAVMALSDSKPANSMHAPRTRRHIVKFRGFVGK
jgi:hypothetical protein